MNVVKTLVTLLCASLLSPCSEAEIPLGGGSVLHFASTKEAQNILTTKDDFIKRLSPFDRSARMKVDRPISEDEFLTFVGKNALDWTASEKQSVQQAVTKVQSVLQDLRPSFPSTVNLIKTTGAEEGNAAYTRGESIMIPKAELTKDRNHLEKLICHELFHILSRKSRNMREKLYEVIGFHKCEELDLPAELKSRKITNPDAPRNDHFIRLKTDGRECQAVPILLSTAATYDVTRGGEFFDYLSFKFLLVKVDPATGRISLESDGVLPRLLPLQAVSDFFEQVGKNTEYVIHPEEILADNFALLVSGGNNIPSPEVLRKMKTVFLDRKS